MEPKNLIGVISIDTRDAGIGYIQGDNLTILKSLTSGVAGKHRKGGQSKERFERLREMHLNEFYHRVADIARAFFLDNGDIKELIISGPAFTKHDFIKGKYLEYRLQDKIGRIFNGCYAGEDGLYETHNILKSSC